MSGVKQVLIAGFLAMTVGMCMCLILVSYIEVGAQGVSATPATLSITLTGMLLPVIPSMLAYPEPRLASNSAAVGIVGGLFLTVEYYAGNSTDYVTAIAAILHAIGPTSLFFFILLGIGAAAVGTTVGWNINYALIAYAKRVNKDWP